MLLCLLALIMTCRLCHGSHRTGIRACEYTADYNSAEVQEYLDNNYARLHNISRADGTHPSDLEPPAGIDARLLADMESYYLDRRLLNTPASSLTESELSSRRDLYRRQNHERVFDDAQIDARRERDRRNRALRSDEDRSAASERERQRRGNLTPEQRELTLNRQRHRRRNLSTQQREAAREQDRLRHQRRRAAQQQDHSGQGQATDSAAERLASVQAELRNGTVSGNHQRRLSFARHSLTLTLPHPLPQIGQAAVGAAQRDADRARVQAEADVFYARGTEPATAEELETMSAGLAPKPVQPGLISSCLRRLKEAIFGRRLGGVCAVCEEQHEVATSHMIDCNTHTQSPTDKRLCDNIRIRLQASLGLPPWLISQYNSGRGCFTGCLLQPAAFKQGTSPMDETVPDTFSCCDPCYKSLLNKKVRACPKFSIANGFAIGQFPMFPLSYAEEVMLADAWPKAMIATYTSESRGPQLARHLQGNVTVYDIFFDGEPGIAAARVLPRAPPRGTIKVSFPRRGQPAHQAAVSELSVDRLRDGADFLLRENEIYTGYAMDEDIFGNLDSIQRDFTTIVPDVGENLTANTRHQHHVETADNLDPDALGDTVLHFWGAGMSEGISDVDANTVLVNNINEGTTSAQLTGIGMRPGSHLANTFDKGIWVRMFPSLFPAGKGGPEEDRQIKVGLEECFLHYLRRFDHRFEQHPSFLLVAVQNLARRRAFSHCRVVCRFQSDDVNRQVVEMAAGDLRATLDAVRDQHALAQAGLVNNTNVDFFSFNHPSTGAAGDNLLKSARLASGYVCFTV